MRKGEKATLVVFWKFAQDSSESQDDGAETPAGRSRLLFTRGYSVFNGAQVDGYAPKADAETPMPERIAHADAFFARIGATVRHGGNQAFYSPPSDHIQMPPFAAFREGVSYYSTLAHEHTHWTAPTARCGDFCAWCEAHGVGPLPAAAETVASYIAECAGRLKVGSIQRRLNAIAEAHKAMGLESPTSAGIVRATLKGIRRTLPTASAQKALTLTDEIRAMVDSTDEALIGTRDRALILLGFSGAFRRSELVGLDIEDCAFGKDGLTVTLRRSKTDQDGAGRKIGIPYGSNPETCPVRTIQAWIEQSQVDAH